MIKNNKWREELIFVIVVMLFILGFFSLIKFDGVIGYTTFEIEAAAAPVVSIWDPVNYTNSSTTYLNFTYNVSDIDFGADGDNITNCTLFLYKSGQWFENETNKSMITPEINQSINITYLEDGSFLWKIGCYDNNSLPGNSSYFNITVDTTTPTISNLEFFAINSSEDLIGIDETAFNFSNIEDIEKMRINFTVSDLTGIEGDIGLFFTANGTGACSLGNNQSATCYNYTNSEATKWIYFQNGTTTNTFQNWGTRGDYINCTWNGSSTARTYTCQIDEHYNPNVWKHYPLNFSDIKWQSGVNQRIKKKTIWKIELDSSNIPIDATEYKLDFRVNYSDSTPSQPILAFLCNTSYSTGNPEISPECQLVAGKLPNQLQDDGTKFRGIFTKSLIENLGDLGYVLIESDTVGNKYYIMKTAYYLGESTIRTSISTNTGTSYTTLADGYESELNLNWFYNGTQSESNVTQFIMKIQTNDTLNNMGNSSNYIMSWVKTAPKNEPPIVDIIVPEINANLSRTIEINWTTAEPENNTFTTNITLRNSTDTTYIASLLSYILSNYSWSNSSSYSDGLYNLTIESCEDTTSDKFCGNNSHQITLDNTKPTINLQTPNNGTSFNCLSSINFTYNASDSLSNIKNCSLYLGYNTVSANAINISDTGIEEGINQSFNLTFIVNSSWVYWKVGCYNDALLHENSSLRKFYLSSYCPPALPREPSLGSSSGMGQSAERSSSTVTESIQTLSGNLYTIDSLIPGVTELKITDPSLSIVKIYLDSAKVASNLELRISEIRNVNIEKPNRDVFKYLNINPNLPESFFNEIKIVFKLHKGYGKNVKLLRYTSSWIDLETKKIDQDNYYDYYEAISPGFSYFAITSEKTLIIEDIKEEIVKVVEKTIERPNKFEILLYSIIPLVVLILGSLILLYYLIKFLKKYMKITLSRIILLIGFFMLVLTSTTEVLFWAILPLCVILLIIFGVRYIIKKYRKNK